jgi:hypothetical protein
MKEKNVNEPKIVHLKKEQARIRLIQHFQIEKLRKKEDTSQVIEEQLKGETQSNGFFSQNNSPYLKREPLLTNRPRLGGGIKRY